MDDLLLRRRMMIMDQEQPFLEISPDLLWMWSAPVDNDVYSNTDWNVD